MGPLRTGVVVLLGFLAAFPVSAAAVSAGHAADGVGGVQPPGTGSAVSGASPDAGGVSWTTYMYDVERTGANPSERTISPANVAALEPVWSLASNGSDFSAPIVVNGTVYYGSWNGDEYAVNASDGAVLWTTYLGTDIACGGYTPMGISSTPAYADGTLYLGGGDGYWYALNASTGATEWRILPGSEADGYYAWASALVYGGALYVGTASCFDNPLVPAGLLEVSLASHNITAQFNATPVGQVGESIWATPALDPATNTVWVATGNENPPAYPEYANAIVGLNATTLRPLGSWQVPNVEGQDSDFGSTPTLFRTAGGTPMVVASNKNGVAYALDRSNVSVNGTWGPVWNLSTGGGFSGGAFDGSTLYLAGGSTVYAVDPANGSPSWTAPMVGGGYIYGSLTWANGLVFAGGGSAVEAIDAANGSVLWSAALPAGQSTVTEPVVADGRVFVASGDYGTNGLLTAYSLQPLNVTFEETGLPSGKSWSVGLDGVSRSSTNGSVVFGEANGTYPYLIRGPSGYVVTGVPPSGNVTVAGANAVVAFAFTKGKTVTLTFQESGLPRKSPWCVSLAGWSDCPVRSSVAVKNLTRANYPYVVASIAGYTKTVRLHGAAVPGSGTVDLTLGGGTLKVAFSEVRYALSFSESGLTGGKRWTVVLSPGGSRKGTHDQSTTGSTLTFSVPNGTYTYSVKPVKGFATPAPGSVTVDGGAVGVNLTFSPDAVRWSGS